MSFGSLKISQRDIYVNYKNLTISLYMKRKETGKVMECVGCFLKQSEGTIVNALKVEAVNWYDDGQ